MATGDETAARQTLTTAGWTDDGQGHLVNPTPFYFVDDDHRLVHVPATITRPPLDALKLHQQPTKAARSVDALRIHREGHA